MSHNVIFEDLSLIDYKRAWDHQIQKHGQVLEAKMGQSDGLYEGAKGYLLLCEHPHVYTLGKHGASNNLLVNEAFLKSINATYYKIDRGGDITYHGPGQIVGYPIIDLEAFRIGLKRYIEMLEEAVIGVLDEYGINGGHLKSATGVWLDGDVPGKARKICAIGVKASRFVTMHGFAFNVNTQLGYFRHINPCGLMDKGVTSMEKELGEPVDIALVRDKTRNHLARVFDMTLLDPA